MDHLHRLGRITPKFDLEGEVSRMGFEYILKKMCSLRGMTKLSNDDFI